MTARAATKRPATKTPAKRKQPPAPKVFALTDAGNGELIAWRNRGRAMFVYDQGRDGMWYVVDETNRWKPDPRRDAIRVIAVQTFRQEAHAAVDDDNAPAKDPRPGWYKGAENDPRISRAIRAAETQPCIRVTEDQLDQHENLVCCPSATWDLLTGKSRPNDPADLITKQTPFNPDFEPSELWERCLVEWMPDPEVRAYTHRVMGTAAIGHNRMERMWFLHGPKRNGKSTMINFCCLALGPDYAYSAPEAFMLAGGGDKNSHGPRSDLVAIRGKRFVAMSEVPIGSRMDEPLAKRLSGGDPIAARDLQESYLARKPEVSPATSVMGCNDLPRFRFEDEALKARMKVIPFPVKFLPELGNQNQDLKEQLRSELPKVLAWIIKGAVAFNQDGGRLVEPPAVVEATKFYFDENDPIGQWVEECGWSDPEDRRTWETCTASEYGRVLYNSYKVLAEETRLPKMSERTFYKGLNARGYGTHVTNKGTLRCGIRLRRPGEESQDIDRTVVPLGRPCRVCSEPTAAHHNGLCPDCRERQAGS